MRVRSLTLTHLQVPTQACLHAVAQVDEVEGIDPSPSTMQAHRRVLLPETPQSIHAQSAPSPSAVRHPGPDPFGHRQGEVVSTAAAAPLEAHPHASREQIASRPDAPPTASVPAAVPYRYPRGLPEEPHRAVTRSQRPQEGS